MIATYNYQVAVVLVYITLGYVSFTAIYVERLASESSWDLKKFHKHYNFAISWTIISVIATNVISRLIILAADGKSKE